MEGRQDIRLAALAHDLRTPMCCVAGAAQMALEAEKHGKDISRQLEQILQAVQTMDSMLERMIQPPDPCTFTAQMLTHELESICGRQAGEKRQKLSMDLSALDGLRLELDYGALTRVLINLIGNAIKYTQEGGVIAVQAKLIHPTRHTGSPLVRFAVADNGMGMKREFLRRMYTPYARAEESACLPGKGLGLSIVDRLVQQMGGSIRVRSGFGKGTTFVMSVPVRVAKDEFVS